MKIFTRLKGKGYDVDVGTSAPPTEYEGKIHYIILTKQYLDPWKIKDIAEKVCDECGYIVMNTTTCEIQDCWYRLEGKSILEIKL